MDPITQLGQLHKKHIAFLSKFTSQMVGFFGKMKTFYKQQEMKRKQIFQEQKQQISRLVLSKKIQNQKNQYKVSKKQAKKQKAEHKKLQKQLKAKLKAPKAPNSAYFMFFIDYKQKIKQDFPQCSMIQTAKMAGRLWKQLQLHQKQTYFLKYEEQKNKYEQAMKQYKDKRKKWNQEQVENRKWQQVIRNNLSSNETKQKHKEKNDDKNKVSPQKQVVFQIQGSQSSQQWGQPAQLMMGANLQILPKYQIQSLIKQKEPQAQHEEQLNKQYFIYTSQVNISSQSQILQKIRQESISLSLQTRNKTSQRPQQINDRTIRANKIFHTNKQQQNAVIEQSQQAEIDNSLEQDSTSI